MTRRFTVPVSKDDAREALRAAAFVEVLDDEDEEREPRTLIHSFSIGGGIRLGADHELDSALRTIDEADEVGWVADPLRHDLAVMAGSRVLLFAVPRPEGVLA